MAKRRASIDRKEVAQIIRAALKYLSHIDAPIIPNSFEPFELTIFLSTDLGLLESRGRLQERKYIIGDLKLVADYLNSPQVMSVPFAVRSNIVARRIQTIIQDLM